MADILAKFDLNGQPEPRQSQLKKANMPLEGLLARLNLQLDDLPEALRAEAQFPVRVPEPYLKLIEPGQMDDPLLMQVLPIAAEMLEVAGFCTDPLQEQDSAIPGLLHKYRSRVLLVTTSACAIHCRYCFRRHFPYQENRVSRQGFAGFVDYIAAHPEINEVILSGGDPLSAPDAYLAELHQVLAQLPQLKRFRIHSRFPLVIPDRLTSEFLALCTDTRFQTILVLHANHARELTDELAQKLVPFKRGGVTLLNQSVLLKGVNDSADTLVELSERLSDIGVLPYYLHVLDAVQGAAHFYVSDERARQLMKQIMARLPGFLVPKLTREVAEKSSKIPLDLHIENL